MKVTEMTKRNLNKTRNIVGMVGFGVLLVLLVNVLNVLDLDFMVEVALVVANMAAILVIGLDEVYETDVWDLHEN
jgi:hypothetical protein